MSYDNKEAIALTDGMSWYDTQIDTKHVSTLKVLKRKGVKFGDKMVTFPTGRFRKEFCIPTFFIPLEEIPMVLASMQDPHDLYHIMEYSPIRAEFALWRTAFKPVLEARLEVGI